MLATEGLCAVDDYAAANIIFDNIYTVGECDMWSTCSSESVHVHPQSGVAVRARYCRVSPWRAGAAAGAVALVGLVAGAVYFGVARPVQTVASAIGDRVRGESSKASRGEERKGNRFLAIPRHFLRDSL